ncbi:luciferase-like protein [Halalkalicoccus jeotgali B3]|uniref:Luciferase-like protein n=2 Tax=Halalkalicoccus jeotgali TaxID=413810 RepID=D8JCV1_HALJB|nr:luciferase-like protein [Halalkalicoccus jeotgali B3]ELY38718.1 luciferase-like protein [Halalkalicoccus jeotgali B3]
MGLTQHPADRDPKTCFAELLEQARIAEASGFKGLFVGEHHFTDDIYFDNFQTLARMAGELGNEMNIGTSVCLLPLHNPALVAERIATLDVISNGNVVFGAAAGYRDAEFDTVGVDKAERAGRITEGIEIIRALWSKNNVSYDGDYYVFENVTTRPQPIQESRPPIWLGGSAPAAVKRAAEIGDAWLIDPVSPVSKLKKAVGLYERELTEEPTCRPIRRDVYVAETTEEAIDIAAPYILDKFDSLSEWGIIDDDAEELSRRERFERVSEGRYLIGTPEKVAGELEFLSETLNVNHLIARVQWPGMDHERALDAIELLGSEVGPRVAEL